MAQFDFAVMSAPDTDGFELADIISDWRDAVHSTHLGVTAPTYKVAGMLWLDNTITTAQVLKYYDGTDWINLITINATANTALGANIVGRTELWVDADEMVPSLTIGPQGGVRVMPTALQALYYLAYDATVSEVAYARVLLPKRFNAGTLTFIPYWTVESGSGTVAWVVYATASSNDDPHNPALGTAGSSVDTLLAANDLHVGPESGAITISGTFADADHIWLSIYRDVASDTLAVDAQLLGIKVIWTSDQGNDA